MMALELIAVICVILLLTFHLLTITVKNSVNKLLLIVSVKSRRITGKSRCTVK